MEVIKKGFNRIQRTITKPLIKMTRFGEKNLDGVEDSLVSPTISNFLVSSLYEVSDSFHRLGWNLLKPRLNLFQSQISSDQVGVLKKLLKQARKPNMKALEIGSWMGFSTKIIGEEVRQWQGKIYCIDSWGGAETLILKV